MDSYQDDQDSIPNMDDDHAHNNTNDTNNNHVYYTALMEFLTDNDGMRAAAAGSLKQGLAAGGGAIAGGLLLGPLGGLVGGVAGSLFGYYSTHTGPQSYQGVLQHVATLEPNQRDQLVRAVQLSLVHAGANARSFESPQQFKEALLQFAGQRIVRDQIWKACVDALE